MHKVNLSQVPVEENPPSPCGRFRSFSQNISIALGHIKDSDSKANSHPFDLEICRVPPVFPPLRITHIPGNQSFTWSSPGLVNSALRRD